MKLRQPFPFILAVSATAASLVTVACSSESTRSPYETHRAQDPSDPAPSAPAPPSSSPPKAPGSGGPGAAAGDCKRAAPSNACGVDPQCGCEAAQTCDVIDSYGVAKCVTAGAAAMGNPCEATASCAKGLTCLFGICHAFCSDPSSACTLPRTGSCAQIKTTDGADVPNLKICRIACDLHDAMSCGGTTSAGTGVCRVDDKGETECQAGGARKEGEACTPEDDCGPGLACTSSTSGSTCKRWCRVGQSDCAGTSKCNGFKNEVNVRGVVYGACS